MKPNTDYAAQINSVARYMKSLGFVYFQTEIHTLGASPDLIAYEDPQMQRPLVIVEIKGSLPTKVGLLDPAVQQAFKYAALCGLVDGHLLVSDGTSHHWFRLQDNGTSLDYAPAPRLANTTHNNDAPAFNEQSLRLTVRGSLSLLRDRRVRIDLRSTRDILRILVSKLIRKELSSQLYSSNESEFRYLMLKLIGRDLIPGYNPKDDWAIDHEIAFSLWSSFESCDISQIPHERVAKIFWEEVSPLFIDPDHAWSSPKELSELIVGLGFPLPGERIIDPACGTGQLLVEAHLFSVLRSISAKERPSRGTICGIEKDVVSSEIALLKFFLVGLPTDNIVIQDAFEDIRAFPDGSFDLCLLDPPTGHVPRDILENTNVHSHHGLNKMECLFIDRGIRFLKKGGRAVAVLPEGFFFSKDRRAFRDWLMSTVTINAIIALPAGSWTASKNNTHASLIAFTKVPATDISDQQVFIADLRSEGQELGPPEHQFATTISLYREFRNGTFKQSESPRDRQATAIPLKSLSPDRLDVSGILLAHWNLNPASVTNQFATSSLGDVSDIISGKHIKWDSSPAKSPYANYIQAGNVRKFFLEIADAPRLSEEQYKSASSGHLMSGDVLITSTGQHLGRASMVQDCHLPAIASSAVSILRVKNKSLITPEFLVAFLNSPSGIEQFEQHRIKGVAQPYLRKSDISEIVIPIPPVSTQLATSEEIRRILNAADQMIKDAEELRLKAHTLLVKVLAGEVLP